MNDKIQTLNDRIAERVGKELYELIPQDEWKAIIERESRTFTEVTMPKVVRDMLHDKLKEDLKIHLSSGDFIETWNDQSQQMCSDAVKEMMVQSAPVLFAEIFSAPMQNVINNMRNQLY